MTLKLAGTLVLLGAGKMGGAMLEGWLNQGVEPGSIVVIDPAPPPEINTLLVDRGIRHNPPLENITGVEALLIAVKPQVLEAVLAGLAGLAKSKPLVLSVVAGKTIAAFEKHFGKNTAVIRTIPNTPAAIGRGITAMASNPNVSPAQLRLAKDLLSTIGEVVTVDDESLIDAATAVSGSGPAYVFYLTECLAAAGEKVGLPAELSMQLARATVSGAGELMRQSGLPATTLRQNVTSPNGTTQAALEVLMDKNAIQALFDKAIAAATKRSKELAG